MDSPDQTNQMQQVSPAPLPPTPSLKDPAPQSSYAANSRRFGPFSLKRICLLLPLLLSLFVLFQYLQYRQATNISCGGDWSYKTKCPLGTYCSSLNQGPLAGGVCTPYLSPFFNSFFSKQILTPTPTGTPKPATATPTPTPDIYIESSSSATPGWKTLRNKDLNFSITFPPDFTFDYDPKNYCYFFHKKYVGPTAGPSNYIAIYAKPKNVKTDNYDEKGTEILFSLEVGESKPIRPEGPLKDYSVYKRLPDAIVGGLPSKRYLSTTVWEAAEDTKSYRVYVPYKESIFLIQGFIENKQDKEAFYISEELFNQILATFRFLD